MARQEELRQESAFCRKSAERVSDPSYRSALIELADWWEWQANLAKSPSIDGDGTATLRIAGSPRILDWAARLLDDK